MCSFSKAVQDCIISVKLAITICHKREDVILLQIVNKMGPSIEPCKTPLDNGKNMERSFPTVTHCCL